MPNKRTLSFTLCGSGSCKCPVVDVDRENNVVKINDDYGNSVQITFEQFKVLKDMSVDYFRKNYLEYDDRPIHFPLESMDE